MLAMLGKRSVRLARYAAVEMMRRVMSPRDTRQAMNEPDTARQRQSDADAQPRRRVLIVEDEANIREVLSQYLALEGGARGRHCHRHAGAQPGMGDGA